jgi:hypothetical protein
MITPAVLRRRPRIRLKVASGTGLAALAALAVLAAAGCGSGSPGSSQAGASHPAGSATPSASRAQTILTGTRLSALLLPAQAMPAGFTLDTQGVRNSVDSIQPDGNSPLPAGQVCQRLAETSWIETESIASASFAQNDYGNAAHTEQFAQEIDAFHGDDAQKVMAGLWDVFGRCHAFTYTMSGMTIRNTLTRSTLTGVGEQAIKAVITSPAFSGGETLVASRVGNNVITCFYSSGRTDLGSAVVPMTETIAKKVAAAG